MNKPKEYVKIKLLGKGAYGKVYKAKDEENNEKYALKNIKLHSLNEGIPSTAIREICLLKELNHINIVKLLDIIHKNNKITLVIEFIDRDLNKIIEATLGEGLSEAKAKSYLYQILKGMAYIHKHKILHRDLKPQNILITNDDIVKIADFGLARGYGLPASNYTHEVVTLWYRAPDVLLGNRNYSTDIDVWSIGCIFEEMIGGKQIFMCKNNLDQLKKIFKILGTPTEEDYPDLEELPLWEGYKDDKKGEKEEKKEEKKDEKKVDKDDKKFERYTPLDLKKFIPKMSDLGLDLLKKMLVINPENRITCEEALKHPYFNDIDEFTLSLYKDQDGTANL